MLQGYSKKRPSSTKIEPELKNSNWTISKSLQPKNEAASLKQYMYPTSIESDLPINFQPLLISCLIINVDYHGMIDLSISFLSATKAQKIGTKTFLFSVG